MKKIAFTLMLLFGAISYSFSQNATLSGNVRDSSSGEDLISASVYITELGTGTVTNFYGFYSITVAKGTYNIVFSYMGHISKKITVELKEDKILNVELKSKDLVVGPTVVKSKKKSANLKKVEMSENKLKIGTIKRMPALLGEVDVIKSIQLLPGVSTVGEGASGFNVRGGGISENLILLDEAPVFNSSHLFGFFSIFNPDAVKDVKLIKGGIPAQYGGRLSSILDVRMKDGNKKKFGGSGGVGVIFSRLMLEGPLVKDKASFIVAARRSYIDVLAKPFLSGDLSDSKFNFYDLTGKVNYKINKRNKLFFSVYRGRDVFGAESAFNFNWGNTTSTLRWNHHFNSRLFSNFTAYYSKYDYQIAFEDSENKFDWTSHIKNYSVKGDFSYFINPHNTLSFGGQSTLYRFEPGKTRITSDIIEIESSLEDKLSVESGIYIDDEIDISKKFSIKGGIRYSTFNYIIKDSVINYGESPVVGKDPKVIKSVEYLDGWEEVQFYHQLEPRFAMKYELNKVSSVKASYNRMVQQLHLISNTTASVPLDVWTPSTNNLKPIKADQIAMGYFRNFGENDDYEFSVETYYKWMYNIVDYRDGADLILNERLEGELLTGDGRAYGIEFFLRKNRGKLTGWISYTLARTERQVEGLNQGDWFPNRYDKTHVANMVAMYNHNKKWEFSANFVFSTGTPATFPTNQVSFYGYNPPHNSFERRNNYRIPAYHRLDLAATYKKPQKKGKKVKAEWVFSLYNAYNKKNPFSIFFRRNPDNVVQNQAVQYSVLGTIVPAVSYNFKF
jgi:hypothetical protein